MKWLRQLYWPFSRRGQWPTRTPPTVAGGGPVVFHCPECRETVDANWTECPACGAKLGYVEDAGRE